MAHADETTRPSRRGWPLRTEPTTTPAGTHQHELPGWLFRAVIGLAITSLLILVAVCVLLIYVVGRGAYRDEETQRIEAQIRHSICDLLDQLPEGGLLDRPREKYGCGPGIPISEFPPEVQQRLEGQPGQPASEQPAPVLPQQTTAPGPTTKTPPAEQSTAAAETTTPPAAPAPPASPTPPSNDEPSPLLDLVCDTTSICLEVHP